MSGLAAQCRGNVGGGEGGGGGGGGGMRTVECLRGRLQAERVASKAAKEEADRLATRLDELEKKLADEVKTRNKAERRLRRAIKRMESLKTLDMQLSVSETSIGSLSLSSNSTGCSGQQPTEMEGRDHSPMSTVESAPLAGGEDKGWDGDSAKGSSAGSCTTQANSSSSQSQDDGSWFSVVSEQSGSGLLSCKEADGTKNSDGSVNVGHDSQREPEQPAASSGSSKSEASYRSEEEDRLALVPVDNPHYTEVAGRPRTEDGVARASVTNDGEEREEESNKLAIVLADPQPQRDAPGMSGGGGNQDVQSVLLALRQVKEQLRYTIERRSEGLVVAQRELYGH
uniref:Uncharacterized protein n=1 Tax=Avena sativa TaxID=4498 RepID=A0ACD5YNB3_AVESA